MARQVTRRKRPNYKHWAYAIAGIILLVLLVLLAWKTGFAERVWSAWRGG